MTGSLLAEPGDIQIGADGGAPILLRLEHSGTEVEGYYGTLDFAPWVPPDMTTSDSPVLVRPGVFQGVDMPTTRKVQVEVIVRAATESTLKTLIREVSAAALPNFADPAMTTTGSVQALEDELAWLSPNGDAYVMYGRYRGLGSADMSRWKQSRTVRLRLRFEANDPAIFEGGSATSVSVPQSTEDPNRVPPYSTPLRFPSGTTVSFSPSGDAPCRGESTFTGFLEAPALWALKRGAREDAVRFIGLGNGPMSDLASDTWFAVAHNQVVTTSSTTRSIRLAQYRANLGGGYWTSTITLTGGDHLNIRALVLPDRWEAGGDQVIAARWGTATNRSWAFMIDEDAKLKLSLSSDGTATTTWTSAEAVPQSLRNRPLWVSVASSFISSTYSTLTFGYADWPHEVAPSALSEQWTYLVPAPALSAQALIAFNAGGGATTIGARGGTDLLYGSVWAVEVGIDGTQVIDWRAREMGATSGTDLTGNAWTVSGSTSWVTADRWATGLATVGGGWFDPWPRAELLWTARSIGTNGEVGFSYRNGWWLPG